MNSNKKENIAEIIDVLSRLESKSEVKKFLDEILTSSEIKTLSKRWRIMKMLANGATQREIAEKMNVSLCKVTRGAKILKSPNAICTKFLK